MTDTSRTPETLRAGPQDGTARTALQYVEEALRGLHYGHVIITVHEGAVVQVERNERRRFDLPRRKGG